MRSEMELGITVEYGELFSFRDRVRQIADRVRLQMDAAGLGQKLEAEVFSEELELRGPEGSRALVRMDAFHLEISGFPAEWQVHLLAALILEEAEVFRLSMVEAGFTSRVPVPKGQPLTLVSQAFGPLAEHGGEPMLDRRFSMTWEWGNATTGFSFFASDTEDRELWLSFKAREGYMNLPDLKTGSWMQEQAKRYNVLVARFIAQLGWQR